MTAYLIIGAVSSGLMVLLYLSTLVRNDNAAGDDGTEDDDPVDESTPPWARRLP